MDDFVNQIKDISMIFVLFLLLIAFAIPISAIGYFMDKKSCIETANKLNYSHNFSFWTGCIVTDTNGNKFLLEQLRQIKED